MLAAATNTPPKIESFEDVVDLLKTSLTALAANFIANLPVYLIAMVVFFIGLMIVRFAMRTAERGVTRGSLDISLQKLALTLLRVVLMLAIVMVAVSVAGIEVGPALAAMGILGLAFAFAFQNILENFIAGLLILIRKPLRIGDQIISGDYEGTVADVNMRVTTLLGYDGVRHLLPNADVFRQPLTNLTEEGSRRSSVMIGIDYRDDIDAVPETIMAGLVGVDGLLEGRPVEVLCTELGGSSVDFEIRYWTLPDSRTVRHTQDRVLRAAKVAVEAAGMSIPWPIRTLEPGAALRLTMTSDD